MDTEHVTVLLRSLSAAPSRRAFFAGIVSGLFAAGPFPFGEDAAAKRNGKGKRKRKKQAQRKNQNQNPSPPPPPPAPTTQVAGACGGPGLRVNINGERRLAQTFTALASGPLVSAQLEIDERANGGAGDYILRLSPVDADGVPTNEVLAESVVADAGVPEGPTTVTFTFATPFSVTAGTEYALVLARPGSEEFAWIGDRGDRCAGQAFSSPQTGTFAAFEPAIEVRFTALVSA